MSTATNYNNNTRIVHELLQQHPDGLTVTQISKATGIMATNVNAVCRRSKRLYIDRWNVAVRPDGAASQWVAVYCLIQAPPDAPRPEMKPGVYLRAVQGSKAMETR